MITVIAEAPWEPYPAIPLPPCPEVTTILIFIFIIPICVLICYMCVSIYSQMISNFVLHIFKLCKNGTICIISPLPFFAQCNVF